MRSLLPLGIPDLTSNNLGTEERAYSTLLPNYDEAVAQYMKQAPPPSYQVAMSNYQTEEERNLPGSAIPIEEDNNNDISNNNNTVHINNNTPTMRRNENTPNTINNQNTNEELGAVGGSVVANDNADNVLVPPPSYNEVIIEPVLPSAAELNINTIPKEGGVTVIINNSSTTNTSTTATTTMTSPNAQVNSNESQA